MTVAVGQSSSAPQEWDRFLARVPGAEVTVTTDWTRLAAFHYPEAHALWITATDGGELVGGLPVLVRRRRGLRRFESSFDGTPGGPQVRADLPADRRNAVADRLVAALAAHVGGRSVVAAFTVSNPGDLSLAGSGWRREEVQTAVIDCRGGLDHVGTQLWTNNRRNERNRGLKRGCTLHAAGDPDRVAAWYPLYRQRSERWAQLPVPLAFLQDMLREMPDRAVFNHVNLGDEIVAGHFGLISRGRLIAWQGAARSDLARSHFLTTLLYWNDIGFACSRGLEAVDFGGSVGRNQLWGFKRRCGAVPERRLLYTRRSLLLRVAQGLRGRR